MEQQPFHKLPIDPKLAPNTPGQPPVRPNMMATASLSFGVCSIILFFPVFNVYLALVFASMGIMFALLSRGDKLKLPDKAVGGLVVSLFSLILILLISIASAYFTIRIFGLETALDPDALQKAMMDMMQKYMDTVGGTAL